LKLDSQFFGLIVNINERFKTPVYLDHHSTTPIDSHALEVLTRNLSEDFGNPHSTSIHGRRAHANLERARQQAADLIGALPKEICFVAGATEANNLAVQGLAHQKALGRTKIITSQIEHSCVLESVRHMATHYGFEIVENRTNNEGLIDLDALSDSLDDTVALVSVMMVNNEIGVIQPIKDIARLGHAVGAIVHTDAAQAVGKLPIDVDDLDIDLLSISAHKMYGPQGVGALFVRDGTPLQPIIFGGSQQRYQSGTVPSALCASFGTACDIAKDRLERDRTSLIFLQKKLWEKIQYEIPGTELNGPQDFENRVPGNLNIYLPGIEAQDFANKLAPYVSLSAGAACASSKKSYSHVLRALGHSDERILSSFRIGVGRSNTDSQIEYAADKIISTAIQLQQSMQAAE
jgi:cysteine desulfurase